MKKFARFALLLPLLATTAEARETCATPRLTPAFEDTESFYDEAGRYIGYQGAADPRQHRREVGSSEWLQRIGFLNLPEPVLQDASGDSRATWCHFDTALDIFDELETSLGKNNPYLAFWTENQNRVLGSCATSTPIPLADLPDSTTSPARAASDLAYQKAAQLFYTGGQAEESDLEKTFLALAHDTSAPMQKRAAVMALRLAYSNGGLDHLMDVAEALRTDPTSEEAYAYAEDTIFTVYWDTLPYGKAHTLESQKKRLRWLVDTALNRNTPRFSQDADTQQDFKAARRNDALYQLAGLISWQRSDGRNSLYPNWWNEPEEPEESQDKAVHQLAQTEPYIDFLATHFVRTPLESWRWALYNEDSYVWQTTQKLADHAFDRFCNGEGVEWLNEAARLMPPQDPDVALMRDVLLKALDDKALQARQPFLRGQLYHQAVRLSLLLKDDATVTALLGRNDINFLGGSGKRSYEQQQRDGQAFGQIIVKTQEQTLAWYAHQGQWDKVQAALDTIDTHADPSLYTFRYRGNPTHIYRLFTAHTMDELAEASHKLYASPSIRLSFLFDQLPTATLLDLLEKNEHKYLSEDLSKELAPRVLVRSWLQNDTAQTQRALQIYTTWFPEKRLDALRASAGNSFDKALFMLRQQIGPIDNARLYSYTSLEKSAAVYNWSGPWCSIVPDEYASAADNVWEFAPYQATAASAYWWYNQDEGMSYKFRTGGLSYDPEKFRNARRQAMAAHPLWQNANLAELQTLTREAGSPYLTNIVNDYASWPSFWNKLRGRGDEIPEALHLAVRTARFGCHHTGDNFGKPSQQAFDTLHKDYGDTLWATNTPYWYK